jgi:GTP pyrophosphokinase
LFEALEEGRAVPVFYNFRMHQSSCLTWRFNVAFEFACGLHHSQTRKSTAVPYIAHLMGVCSLALDAGADEDQAIAALLHDAVEDQGGLATLETIRQLFGSRVAAAVESCSDSTVSDPAQKLPWRERKEKYLAHLPQATADALMVSAADKLHNARAILRDYRHLGDEVWRRFKASKKDQLWYYSQLVEVFKKTAAPKVLVEELERVVNDLRET